MGKNWDYRLLSSVCEEITSGGAAPQGEKYFLNGKYPFVRVVDMGNLQGKKTMSKTRDMVNDEGAANLRLFPRGTILFTKSGASLLLNQRAILKDPMFVVSHIGCLIPNESVLPEWLYYWMKTIDFNVYAHATTLPSLKLSTIKDLHIPLPPLSEQARIVARIEEMFSQLDAGTETLLKTKAQLAVYREAVLKEAFDGTLTAEWRKTHQSDLSEVLLEVQKEKTKKKRADKYHLEYDVPLKDLPDSWKWVFVGDISKGPEYGSSQKSLKEGKVPVIRMGNIKNGEIVWEDLAFSDHEAEIKKYRLKKGDVLFNRTNSPELVGKTAIYRGEREAIFAGYLIRVNQIECVDSVYLSYYLNSPTAKQYGNKVKTDGVNQSNINGTKLCSYPFPLCSLEEQRQVVYELETRLSVCDSIEQTIETALQQTEAMRQSILKDAFNG